MTSPSKELKDLLKSNKCTKYEITICPDDKHQYFGQGDRRLECWLNSMDRFLRDSLDGVLYTLYTDISTPHVNVRKGVVPRLHLHGILEFMHESKARFWVNNMYKLSRWAIVTVNPLRKDEKEWIKYCQKTMPMLKLLTHDKESWLTFRSNGRIKKY